MGLLTKLSFSLPFVLLIVLFYTDKSLASPPPGPPTCKFKCRGPSASLLKLEEGVTYLYNLEGATETFVPKAKGPFGETTKLNINAKVEVSALPQCKTIIQLRGVQVTGPDGKSHQSLHKLEQHPLVVSLHGGKLDSEVCAVHDDEFASLNIKRAVASLLQVNTGEHGGNGQETDVFGSCPTYFKVTKEGEGVIVNKHRDLERCQFRENLRQSLFAVSHAHGSDFQSSPLLNSQYDVEQKITQGVLESATAKEEYLYRPFANGNNGARTKVTTKLVLESKNPSAPTEFPNNEPKQIFFENPHETVTCSIQTLLAALHQVTDHNEGSVSETAAKDFNNLVKLTRRASKDDLLTVYGNCKAGAGFQNRELAKQVFADALFEAGSGDSVAAAVELLKNNEITGKMVKLWFLSFAFVRHTSASTLASVMSLLDNPSLPKEAYLGVGALASHYCRQHNCDSVPEFDQLLAKFVEVIGAPAKVPRDKENYIIAVLKGLGNIKRLNDETANKITQIMKDSHVSTRIRVAALEAAATDACRGKILKGSQDLFYNRDEDSEIRINAYLAMVECPNAKLANKLSEFIETEPVNQVGAFVTSHLRNLRSSYNPDKEHVREILYNVKPRKKFPFDVRAFSQNHEFSYNFNSLGSSAEIESNVIFSQKSYVPRSMNLNLTVEVFGHAFNLFELKGRVENVERMYERYFGPKGYFRTHKLYDIVRDTRNLYKDFENKVDEKYKNLVSRGRRSVSRDDTNNFASKVKLFNNKLDNNIDIDLSMKVLGNELAWVNIEDIEAPITPSALVEKAATFVENSLGKVKDYHTDYKRHFQMFDTEVTYPTSTGLPLRLSASGTGATYLKFGANCDLASFIKDFKHGHAKFEIIPSASLQVDGELSIDGYAVEAGIKLSGNLHTSTGSEVTLQMLDGHGFDLNVGLPVKKSDVVTINTEVFSFTREQGMPSVDHPLEFNVPRKDYHGCFDQLQTLVGLTFCGDVGFPSDQKSVLSSAANYPLNGPSKLSLRLEKEDETLTTYHFRFFYDLKNPTNKKVEFKIDTPGTKTPREVSFLAGLMTQPEKAIDLQFISPIHRFVARGALIENDNEFSLSGFAKIDDTQEYKAKLGFLKNGPSYTPVLEYTPIGNMQLDVKVEGEVLIDKQPGSPHRRYTFRGVKLVSPKRTYSVDGTVQTGDRTLQTDLTLGYKDYTATVKSDLGFYGTNHIKLNGEFTHSKYSDFNFGLNYEYQRGDHHVSNNLAFAHGRELNHKLTVVQDLQYKYENLQNFDISTKNTISYPAFQIEGRLDGAATRKSVHYDIEGMYGKHKFHSKLNAKTSVHHVGDYELEFLVGTLQREIFLEAKREVVSPNKARYTQKLEMKPGKAYDLAAEVTHHIGNNEINIGVIATSTNYPNYVLDVGVQTNPGLFDSHLKINDGTNDVVDGIAKYVKGHPYQVNHKLFVDKFLDYNGDYSVGNGKVHGTFAAHFMNLDYVLLGSTDLTKTDGRYAGVIDLSNKKAGVPRELFHIETDTAFTPKNIDSKNKMKIYGKESEFNFHGTCEGKSMDIKAAGGYELTLPSGRYISGNFKESHQCGHGTGHGEIFGEFMYAKQKGGPTSKVTLDAHIKDFDLRRHSVDSKFVLHNEYPSGDFKFSNSFRCVPQDSHLVIDEESSWSGSLVKMPFEYKGHAVVSRPEVSFDASSVFGEYHLKSNGKILTGLVDKVRHLEFSTEITTPLEKAKRVHWENLFHFAQGDENQPHKIQIKQGYSVNEKSYKFEGEGDLHVNHGNMRATYTTPRSEKPTNVDFKYKRDVVDHLSKVEVSFNSACSSGDHINLNGMFDYAVVPLYMINGHITGQSSLQKLQNIDLTFSHKKLSSSNRNSDFTIVLNGEKLEGSAKLDLTPRQPIIDLSAVTAAGKSRFYYKLVKKSDRQASCEGQIAWTLNGGGQCDYSSSVDIESYDNFHVVMKVNSEKLKINKLKLEAGNRAAKSGTAKKINFAAQTADKKGFSGSVTYAVKESPTGFTIEGKGQVEVQSEKHPLTYKAEYKALNSASDSEMGTSFVLNADFGKGALQLEQKLSDKELLYLCKFCKDGQCAHSELKNVIHVTDISEMSHEAHVLYQNNFNGKNYDYKAFMKTHRKGFTIDNEAGLKMIDRNYGMKYYVHEGEGGLVFDLPHREIAAVASYDLPIDLVSGKPKTSLKNIQTRFDGSLYLDRKNKPNEKGSLFIFGDFAASTKSVSTKGEIKVSHPALTKDLVLRGKAAAAMDQRLIDASIDVDVFNKKNQRIALTVTVDHIKANDGHNITGNVEFISKGMNMDLGTTGHLFASENALSVGSFLFYHDSQNVRKEAGALFESSPQRLYLLVRAPQKELLRVDSVVSGSPEQKVIDTEVVIAELRHYAGKVETHGFHTLKASYGNKASPDRRIEITSSVTPMLLEFKVDRCDGPHKDNLIGLALTSSQNQETQPNFHIDSEKIKQYLERCKESVKKLGTEVKDLAVNLAKESADEYTAMFKSIKKVQPDFKPLLQHIQTEFQAIRKELEEDPHFHKCSTIVQTLFGGFLEALEVYSKKLAGGFEKFSHEFGELQTKLAELFKEILTRATERYEKMSEPLMQLLNKICDVGCALTEYLLKCLKANEPAIKQTLVLVSGYIQDFALFCSNTFEQIFGEVQDFFKGFLAQLKSCPLFSNFQDKYKELTNVELPQTIKNFYSELTFAAEDMMKTPELKGFFQNFIGYAIKFPVPSFLVKLPKVGGVREFSIIRYLKYITELPSLTEIYYTYRPSLRIEENIPPYKAYAIILASHHFFTFDQKHYDFQGSCSYILAQDFLDGNFSIVAHIENGKINSITLNDQHDTVEVFHDNSIAVNGQRGDFPVDHNDFHAWLRYGTFNLMHKSGVFITKYFKQDMIIFRISGFYFGRTRGLLGTISNEHYDDFLLPNGHVAKDANEFIDAYKVNDACPAATAYPPHETRVPECTKYFTSGSRLSGGFPYINPEIYREACDLHASSGALDPQTAACDVSSAYVLALKQKYKIYATVPDECISCVINGQPAKYGDKVTVQTPQGKADVVIVFEQSAFNSAVFKELITPLIPSLSNDLKEKGLGDVEFALIGYGGPQNDRWPRHYGNNGKVTYEGKADKIEFKTAEDPKLSFDTWENRIKYVYHFINTELGRDPIVVAMEEANIYPFRQGASKIILLVNSGSCPMSPFFPFSLQLPRIFAIRKYYKDLGLQFHFITPMSKTMTLNNKPDELKNVVGFDSDKIYTFADAKKSELEGDAANRPHLVVSNDLCIAFSQYNGGAAFNSNVFTHAKPEQQKKFVHVVSKRIANGAVAHQYTETCTCNLYHGLFHYPSCKIVDRV